MDVSKVDNGAQCRTPARQLPPRQQALSRACARSRTSASTCAAARATRCAARTAPARARWASCWPASTQPDAGEIIVDGRAVQLRRIRATRCAAGIGMVHQELAFCENLSVAENLCLGDLPARGLFVVARRDGAARARDAGRDRRADRRAPPGRRADRRRAADGADRRRGRQRRARDHLRRADEQPVAARDRAPLRAARSAARARRHLRATSRTACRRSSASATPSRCCATAATSRPSRSQALDEAALVQLMIGRRLEEYLPVETTMVGGGEVLRVEELSSPRRFARHQLLGARRRGGRHRPASSAPGAPRSRTRSSGWIRDAHGRVSRSAGIPLGLRSPAEAMRAGVGFVPEDRKRHGLVLSLRALENVTLPTLRSLSRARLDSRRRRARARGRRVRAPAACARPISTRSTAGLSGGNQQKLVLAKWLAARCRVLILDEPTRGVDVGAKAEIHALIGRLAAEGTGDPADLERAARAGRAVDAHPRAARRAARPASCRARRPIRSRCCG